MSENNCAVYVHVNLINGKKYFGITVREPEARWGKDGKRYEKNDHFWNAINKYGWDEGFAHYVLYRNIPIKIAKYIEEMLIREHFSYDPRFGYNKTMGGELEIPTEETRRKVSEALKEYFKKHPEANSGKNHPMYGKTGENHPRFGKHHSEETRRKMRENHADISGKNHPMYGKHLNEETRKKISKNNGMKRPEVVAKLSKSVEAIDPESGHRVLYFKSIMDAGRAGFSQGNISSCCNGKRKTHAGLIWRFDEGGDNDGSDNRG